MSMSSGAGLVAPSGLALPLASVFVVAMGFGIVLPVLPFFLARVLGVIERGFNKVLLVARLDPNRYANDIHCGVPPFPLTAPPRALESVAWLARRLARRSASARPAEAAPEMRRWPLTPAFLDT